MNKLHVLLRRLWQEESGFIVSSELAIWAMIVVISVVVGITSVRVAMCDVFVDAAEALANREFFDFDTSSALFFERPTTMNLFDQTPALDTGTEAGPKTLIDAVGEQP